MISRRSLFGGFVGLLAAPAIVKASSLMAVKPLPAMPAATFFFGEISAAEEADFLGLAYPSTLHETIQDVTPFETPFMRLLAQQSRAGDRS